MTCSEGVIVKDYKRKIITERVFLLDKPTALKLLFGYNLYTRDYFCLSQNSGLSVLLYPMKTTATNSAIKVGMSKNANLP